MFLALIVYLCRDPSKIARLSFSKILIFTVHVLQVLRMLAVVILINLNVVPRLLLFIKRSGIIF